MANGGQHAPVPSATPVSVVKSAAAPRTPHSDSAQSKRDLASWWKGFKRGNVKPEEPKTTPTGIFGVPLHESIRYANVAISLFNDEGQSYIYGYVPIVVAKCGVFLKEKATETEGIFRLAGSEKRIKELRLAFDSPDKYGKGLDWTGYTVHDAANILRRYFNQLPEPIIPLGFYERFRVPLRNHQEQAVGNRDSNSPQSGGFDADAAIRAYQGLITELPPLNRQLLLYILDLLAVFASKSDMNKMNTSNLAAIFQPGILSHPQHDLAPQEYRLSQDVLIFLIENQDHFLIGMHGTAADEKTVQEVQSGYQHPPEGSPTGAPSRSRTVIGRSSSGASGGSQGNRAFSGIRRNVSTSSRNSRQSSGQPGSPALGSPSLSGGVHRSNTVPSQRTATSPRFPVDKSSDPPTPTSKLPTPLESTVIAEEGQQDTPEAPVHDAAHVTSSIPPTAPAGLEVTSASSSEATTPLAAPAAAASGILPSDENTGRTSPSPLLSPVPAKRDASNERSGSRTLLDRLRPPSGGEGLEKKEQRQTKKLQKKRVPSSNLSSAHSSTHDLGDPEDHADQPLTPQYRDADPMAEARPESSAKQRIASDSLGPGSPDQSFQSRTSITDVSDAEYLDEQVVGEKQEKKKRWRFSHSAKSRQVDGGQDSAKSTPPMPASSSVKNSPDVSRSGSGAQAFQASTPAHSSTMDSGSTEQTALTSDSDEKKKGPIGWIRGKIHERKEKDAEKRAKSPTPQAERQRSVQAVTETQPAQVQAVQTQPAQVQAVQTQPAQVQAVQTPAIQAEHPQGIHAPQAPASLPTEASSGVSSAGTPTPTPSTSNVTAEASTQAAAVAAVPAEEKKEEVQTEGHAEAEVKE